jgi:hypothetical protein
MYTSIPEGINSGCDAEISLQACRKVRRGLNKYGLQIAMTVHIIRIAELASPQRRLNWIARVFLLLPLFGKQIDYLLSI